MQELIAFTTKTIIIFICMFLLTRVLSKKAISQLSPFEFVGIIIISDNIGVPLETESLIMTIYGAFLIVVLIILTGRLAMLPRLSEFLEEVPTVLMENGEIMYQSLKDEYMSLNQFLALIRIQGYDSVEKIDSVILEPNGQLSIFPKPCEKCVTVSDLKLPLENNGFAVPIVIDGRIVVENLAHTKITEEELYRKLKTKDLSDFLLIEVTKDRRLYTLTK